MNILTTPTWFWYVTHNKLVSENTWYDLLDSSVSGQAIYQNIFFKGMIKIDYFNLDKYNTTHEI